MFGEKEWWRSKGVWGGLIGVAALLAGALGVHVDEATRQLVIDQTYAVVVAVGALGGTLLGIYGRVKATSMIAAPSDKD